MKKLITLAVALVFSMSLYLYADDEPDKTRPGRNTDNTYGHERSNEVNKGKQGELMKEKNAQEQENKKEEIKAKKDSKKESREAKKEARKAKREMKKEKQEMKKNK